MRGREVGGLVSGEHDHVGHLLRRLGHIGIEQQITVLEHEDLHLARRAVGKQRLDAGHPKTQV
jgi:hypothetical protein